MRKKVFNWSEVHFSEVTSYKIHTLEMSMAGVFHAFNMQPENERIFDSYGKEAKH